MLRIVECVPNFSEGQDQNTIDEIARAIRQVKGVEVLDIDMGASTNRTVVTFIGPVESIADAAFAAIRRASELIDMAAHHGEHPRIGATDVCPFVPICGVAMEECVAIAHAVAKRVAELKIPVYLYEDAATCEKRRNLADIRAGEYEGLPDRFKDPEWRPDYGEAVFNPRSGATVIGAREVLIAYNVNVNTRSKNIAREIASNLRERGMVKKVQGGESIKIPGRFTHLKGVGWYIAEYKIAQASFNLTNYKITPLHEVFDACSEEAEKLGAKVTGSEIVGLVPLNAMLEAGRHYLRRQKRSGAVPEEELIHIAIESMGLKSVQPFDPEEKIIEYRIRKARPLVSMKVADFVKEVSMDSPAPGGGSVSALAGALSAALTTMACNLTVGKKGYEAHFGEVEKAGCALQEITRDLIEAVDRDTEAFNGVIAAKKLPKKTEEEKRMRSRALEEGYQNATRVPLETARLCLGALKNSLYPAQHANKNAISDVAVGSLMGYAGFYGAMLNVLINLPSVASVDFREKMLVELRSMEKEAAQIHEEIMSSIRKDLESKLVPEP